LAQRGSSERSVDPLEETNTVVVVVVRNDVLFHFGDRIEYLHI
jgi:hypothetical protein